MQSHQIGKSDHQQRPDASQQQYLYEKQNAALQKRAILLPPGGGSPLLGNNQFPMKQPAYPPNLLNHLYMNNPLAARDHPLYWARNDLRQRIALSSPRMDYYHQEPPPPPLNINNNNNGAPKENGKEPHPSEGGFGNDGGGAENASDSDSMNPQRKVGHSIKTGVSLRCAYCNGDFRSR